MKRGRSPETKNTYPPEKTPNCGSEAQQDIPRRVLSTLSKPVSPPRRRSKITSIESDSKLEKARFEGKPSDSTVTGSTGSETEPNNERTRRSSLKLSAIESGQATITDHLAFISSKLSQCVRPFRPDDPCVTLSDWAQLYQRNQHENGCHFVIHQHDHPIAGTHYDLRLQFSESSSVSWSIVYGLPGDPNSHKLNRNAIETRVHCLWSHLIETASEKTGSMLVWDTGQYEILPHTVTAKEPETESDSSVSMSDLSNQSGQRMTDNEKLREAFRNGKIRLRLHGTRLPSNYTIILRIDKKSDFLRSVRSTQKRRRGTRIQSSRAASTSSSEPDKESMHSPAPNNKPQIEDDDGDQPGSDDDDTATDDRIRENNAYPGATNSIGSVHQRRWFITLDRLNSGFACETSSGDTERTRKKKRWVRKHKLGDQGGQRLLGFEPFYVRGPNFEKSVITGRLAKEVLSDEEVNGFVRRRGWRAVLT